MWTRKELKEKGRLAMSRNYWKTVLIALILAIAVGAGSGFAGSASGGIGSTIGNGLAGAGTAALDEAEDTDYDDPEGFNDSEGLYDPEELFDPEGLFDPDGGIAGAGSEGSSSANFTDGANDDSPASVLAEAFGESGMPAEVAVVFIVVVFLIIIIALVFALALSILFLHPAEVGCSRFSLINLNREAQAAEVAYGFDHSYKNVVKVMFFRSLFTFLWSLLFVIPGIVKSYEYRMIPFILAEHPEMETDDVFAMSRELMRGQKWNTFVLDLSFIGWELLSVLTAGLLDTFFVDPYRMMTNAALYERLVYGVVDAAPADTTDYSLYSTQQAAPETNTRDGGNMLPPSEF